MWFVRWVEFCPVVMGEKKKNKKKRKKEYKKIQKKFACLFRCRSPFVLFLVCLFYTVVRTYLLSLACIC